MEFHSFSIRCSPGERKIYISSEEEFEYRIIIKSICSGRVLWDSIHQIPQIGPIWISPSHSDGNTDPFKGGFTCKILDLNGDILGEHFWKPIRKKVLFITPHLSTGGCPQYLYRKIVEHNKEIEAYVVEWDNIGGDAFVVQKNRIRDWVGPNRLFTLGEDKDQIFNIIQDLQPEVIHFEELGETFVPYSILERIFLGKDRNYFITETTHSSFSKKESKVFLPDKFFFVSDFSQKEFEPLGVPSEVWQYPIDDLVRPDRDSSLQELGLDPNFLHVLQVGLFTPGKNQKETFELAKRFLNYKIRFHFLGNQAGNFEDYWKPLMDNKPENCIVWGERNDADRFMMCCDVFAFPSTFELNPLVVKEALSWKMPVMMRKLYTYGDHYDGKENVHYINDDIDRSEKILREILYI
jgi:glycosyltransferase involved in cell wall biosynthesis